VISSWTSGTPYSVTSWSAVLESISKAKRPSGSMLTEADVVVIGGGIFGSSTAFYLSKETKLKVVVVEKEPIGGASSGKSAAIVRHFYSTDLLVKTALESRKIYQNFQAEVGEPLEFVHNTELVLSAQGEAVNDFEGRLKRFGIDARMIYPEEIRQRFPFLDTDQVVCGLFDLDAGFVYSPLEAVSIYSRQAQKKGARVYNDPLPQTEARSKRTWSSTQRARGDGRSERWWGWTFR
jgi:glycine/D-amino acid oxidase-like deaminating enzyme